MPHNHHQQVRKRELISEIATLMKKYYTSLLSDATNYPRDSHLSVLHNRDVFDLERIRNTWLHKIKEYDDAHENVKNKYKHLQSFLEFKKTS